MKARSIGGRVKLLSLSIVLFAVVACGALVLRAQKGDIATLEQSVKDTRLRQVEAESELSALQYELSISDKEYYIAQRARSLYGYLSPGEIRFKVTNPEALYGETPNAQIVEVGQ